VYRYVLAQAGAHLLRPPASGDAATPPAPLAPEQIEMVYWFAQHPDAPERFLYHEAQFRADSERLTNLAREIQARTAFDLTPDRARCTLCTYRSLCRRGVRAGSVDALDDDFDEDLLVNVEDSGEIV
jgi:hypothetical protein